MKNILASFFAFAMLFAVVGCGDDDKDACGCCEACVCDLDNCDCCGGEPCSEDCNCCCCGVVEEDN